MPYGSDGRAFEVDLLNGLTARCDSQTPPSKHEIEVALELGFASLMALEAELQLIRSEGVDVQPRIAGGSVGERLAAQIEALRIALTTLRARTSSDRAASFELGFVLPSKH
jgi:hypothetical protein